MSWSDKIIQIPAENERNKKYRTEIDTNRIAKYFINDPDGYTNLRKENNTNSKVIQKVNSGESVNILKTSGDWFYVEINRKHKQETKDIL